MASRVLAQLLIAGGTVLVRAATQAYRQAIVNGAKAGMTAEGVQAAAKAAKQMTLQEAEMILGTEAGAPWSEVLKRYEIMFKRNEENGTFYIQSKIYRAKERLEQEYKERGLPVDEPPSSEQQQQQ